MDAVVENPIQPPQQEYHPYFLTEFKKQVRNDLQHNLESNRDTLHPGPLIRVSDKGREIECTTFYFDHTQAKSPKQDTDYYLLSRDPVTKKLLGIQVGKLAPKGEGLRYADQEFVTIANRGEGYGVPIELARKVFLQEIADEIGQTVRCKVVNGNLNRMNKLKNDLASLQSDIRAYGRSEWKEQWATSRNIPPDNISDGEVNAYMVNLQGNQEEFRKLQEEIQERGVKIVAKLRNMSTSEVEEYINRSQEELALTQQEQVRWISMYRKLGLNWGETDPKEIHGGTWEFTPETEQEDPLHREGENDSATIYDKLKLTLDENVELDVIRQDEDGIVKPIVTKKVITSNPEERVNEVIEQLQHLAA